MIGTSIAIHLNGASLVLEGSMSVGQLVVSRALKRELVAVEINREIVRRTDYDTRLLSEGDQVEIVEFVGGG